MDAPMPAECARFDLSRGRAAVSDRLPQQAQSFGAIAHFLTELRYPHLLKQRLPEFNVHVMPDFVLDDHPAVVQDFGGFVVPLTSGTTDRSLLEALAAIEALAASVPS